MIKIELTRYWTKLVRGEDRKVRRATSTLSEDQVIVVLEGRHGRYVIVYDEAIGVEITTSDDVSLMREDIDLAGAKIKRWRSRQPEPVTPKSSFGI